MVTAVVGAATVARRFSSYYSCCCYCSSTTFVGWPATEVVAAADGHCSVPPTRAASGEALGWVSEGTVSTDPADRRGQMLKGPEQWERRKTKKEERRRSRATDAQGWRMTRALLNEWKIYL